MDYPANIRTRKSKLVYFVYRTLYVFDRGKGFVGRFTSTATELSVFYILLRTLNINPTPAAITTAILLAIMVCYTLGKIILKYNVDRIEKQVNSERDPIMNDVHKQIVKNREEW